MPGSSDRAAQSRAVIPVLALVAAVVLVVSSSFMLAYRDVDRLTEERQIATLANAIRQQGRSLEREVRGETVWYDAFVNTAVAPNRGWMHDFLGSYLSGLLGYDEVYVLDGDNQPIYGFEDGVSSDGSAFESHRPDIADMVAAVRTTGSIVPGVTATQVDAGGLAFEHRSISDVRTIAGQPVSVVVETIVPDSNPGPFAAKVRPALLVATFKLDRAFLERFGRDFDYSGLHWAEIGNSSAPNLQNTGPGEVATLVLSSNFSLVGTIAWRRLLPGQELLGRMTAGLAMALALLVGAGLITVRAVRRNTQEIQDSERREAQLARTDYLTGLCNRLSLSEQTAKCLDALRPGQLLGVAMIDLDGFKRINDTQGHQVGDLVLVATARRLREAAPNCHIARMGGDEFALLIPADDADQVRRVAEAVVEALKPPVQLDSGESIPLGGSVGYALAPLHGMTEAELYYRSDLALNRVKKDGRGRAKGFDAGLEAMVLRRRTVETALRRAIEQDAIRVAYQPLMAPDGKRVLGVEALARWDDPGMGSISPVEFIPIAEESGLIVQLGEQILRRALTDAAAWPDLTVSVNVSAQQIQHSDVAAMVRRELEACRFPAGRLEIELTESSLVADEARADRQITALQSLGVKVALDDFGTGYASLLYLRQFGFDKLKIDRQFVQDSDTSTEARAMVMSITSMCSSLGLDVTAEGVENAEQHDFLKGSGCDRLQGYLFSRPIPAIELSAFIAGRRLAA